MDYRNAESYLQVIDDTDIYRSRQLYMDHVDRIRFTSLFVTPNYSINAHPFISQSYLHAQADIDYDTDSDDKIFCLLMAE